MFSTAFTYMSAVAPTFSYLLNEYPSATVAYSTRKLRSAYTGNCMEVRRSSDNTTQNIGFVDNVLDTASLLSFVGAGEGYVKTWYDQSGNAKNATQTTNSSQPRIVNGGVVETQGGKSSVRFTSTASPGVYLDCNPNQSQPNSAFIVYQSDGVNGGHLYDSASRQLIGYTPAYCTYAGAAIIFYGTDPTTFGLVSAIFDGANSSYQFNDGLDKTGNPGTAQMDQTQIFRGQGGNSGTGYISEFVIYSGAKTAERSGIKTNMNNYYSLY